MSLRSLLLFLTSTAYRSSNWWRRRRRRRIVSIIGRWGPFLSLFPPLSSLSFPIRFVISFDFILMKKKNPNKTRNFQPESDLILSFRFCYVDFIGMISHRWSVRNDRWIPSSEPAGGGSVAGCRCRRGRCRFDSSNRRKSPDNINLKNLK